MGAKKGNPPEKVRCSSCKEIKPRSSFSKRLGTWKGVVSHCHECRRKRYGETAEAICKRARKHYRENKEEISRRGRELRVANPARQMFYSAKRRARDKGIPFSISIDEIEVPKICPVFGFPLRVAEGKCRFDSPSIDRIKPELGYVPGNVVVVSHKANTIKNNASIDDLKSVISFYEGKL